MHDKLQNIISEYSLTDLTQLENLLKEFKEKKKTELESSPTVNKFSVEYSEYIGNTFSAKYLESVNCAFKHVKDHFEEKCKLKQIGVKEAEAFKYYLMKLAPKGYVVYIRTLKAAFYKAMEWGYIETNPFSKIKFRSKQSSKPLFLLTDELEKIQRYISNPSIKNIVTFSFYSGCRLGEVVNLRWCNIELQQKLLTIGDENFRTKNSKQRVIPMSKEIFQMLNKLYEKKHSKLDFVFTKSSQFKYNKDYISSIFKEACRKAGLDEKIHFHTLRHSFASILSNKNVPLNVIKELMGHSDISTTMVYAHTDMGSLQAAIQKFDLSEND